MKFVFRLATIIIPFVPFFIYQETFNKGVPLIDSLGFMFYSITPLFLTMFPFFRSIKSGDKKEFTNFVKYWLIAFSLICVAPIVLLYLTFSGMTAPTSAL